MTTFYEIPLSSQPQTFTISLGGLVYNLTVLWRDAIMGGWFLDIADSTNTPLACGLPLVTGTDLLAQLAYLGIAGSMVVTTDGDINVVPTFANLGTLSHLWFVTTP